MIFAQNPNNDALHRAAELNAEGVYCLAVNDSHGAVTCFKSALSRINVRLNETTEVDSVDRGLSQQQLWDTVTILGMEDEAFYVYNQALIMDADAIRMAQNLSTASVVILFNLALAYHRHGMRYRQKAILQKACKVYKMCAGIIMDGDEEQKKLTNQASAVGLVAMNNQAHIHYRLLEDPDTSLELLNHLGKWYLELDAPVPMDPMQLDEVLLNITTLPSAPLRASPAA